MGRSDMFDEHIPAASYTGLLADAYDAWLPPGTPFPDDRWYEHIITEVGGTALELGTGNGRWLLAARARGIDVEGVEASRDMIDICRRRADADGLDVVVHEGGIAPLALDRRYHALVCPAGTFTLLADRAEAEGALVSWHAHLEPGGRLAMGCHTETDLDGTDFGWRLRRTGTDAASGITYVAHEAVGRDDSTPDVQLVFSRVESYDATGLLTATRFGRIRLRSWTRDGLREALVASGFGDVEFVGSDEDWVVAATAR